MVQINYYKTAISKYSRFQSNVELMSCSNIVLGLERKLNSMGRWKQTYTATCDLMVWLASKLLWNAETDVSLSFPAWNSCTCNHA